jgi:hypothetical protein
MTIGAAWISTGAEGEELWIASDSRLSGDGNIWDTCPKLFLLPRRDAVAGFSGSTAQAYPLLLQLANTISCYQAAADGTLDFLHLVGHLERVVNTMMNSIMVDPAIIGGRSDQREFTTRGDVLVVGGYSRIQRGLLLRALHYNGSTHMWTFDRIRPKRNLDGARRIAVFGDVKATRRFTYLLRLHLQEQGVLDKDIPLKFEPLLVMGAMLRLPPSPERRVSMSHRPATIGGVPQIIHLFPGARATALAVHWESGEQSGVFLQGRRIFSYEHLDIPLATFSEARVQIHGPGRWPADVISQSQQPPSGLDTPVSVVS